MELALIPPHCYAEDMLTTNYHLLLAQLMVNEEYMSVAYSLGKDKKRYVILDNGAAEGATYGAQPLFIIADELSVDEVVIPDVIKDAIGTVELLAEFMYEAGKRERQLKYMFVAQGTTWDEIMWSVEKAVAYPTINTIGIPRHLLQTLGDNNARMKLYQMLYRKYEFRFEYHLLGCSPYDSTEMKRVGALFGNKIRGVDTSIPYVYGFYGEWLSKRAAYDRPDNYFNTTPKQYSKEHVTDNIRQLRRWVYDG